MTPLARTLARLETLGMRLGLESFRRLLAALGNPQLRFPAVLVAGSNGKGSTSALLSAMAWAAGRRTGLYTSPHLESVEERLRIDGRAVDPGRLGELVERVVATAERQEGMPPTYFEALTAAAFLWFAEEEVDLAVVEVGMGGRLDATNLCDPAVSLVTSISLEHQEHLGNTLAAIAREKAGTFRSGRPALAWIEEPEAAVALKAVAAETGARLRFAPEEVTIQETDQEIGEDGAGQRVRIVTPSGEHDLWIALPGPHQAKNLALAVLAAETLGTIDATAIARGAAACRWPGRLERIDLPGGRRVILDAAHNPEGASALADFLDRLDGPVDLLFGVLEDKDVAEMLGRLAARAGGIVLTTPASPRARKPEEVAALLAGRPDVVIEPDPALALDRALTLPGPTLVACGSIFLIGEIRKGLRERFGVPQPAAGTIYLTPQRQP